MRCLRVLAPPKGIVRLNLDEFVFRQFGVSVKSRRTISNYKNNVLFRLRATFSELLQFVLRRTPAAPIRIIRADNFSGPELLLQIDFR